MKIYILSAFIFLSSFTLTIFFVQQYSPIESSFSSYAETENSSVNNFLYFNYHTYELNPENIKTLHTQIQSHIDLVKKNQRTTYEESLNRNIPTFLVKDSDLSDKKAKKALEFLEAILAEYRSNNEIDKLKLIEFNEVSRALEMSVIPPAKASYTVGELITQIYNRLFKHPELKGKSPALVDSHSIFWTEPKSIQTLDLKVGFNRKKATELDSNSPCEFLEPKSGYGVNPGITITCDQKEYKIKYKETNTEPFGSRIFWALGYNVEPVDNLPFVKIKYDRKVLTGLNDRDKNVNINLTLFNKVIKSKSVRIYQDPLLYIERLVLKNGEMIPHNRIAEFLFINANLEKKENFENNYNIENEARIDYIVTTEVQIQEPNKNIVKIGPWSFGDFDHYSQKEMRGLLLLAAWVNWADIRADNNRVALVKTDDNQVKAKLFINDLGGMYMGRLPKILLFKNSRMTDVNYFSESFTRRTKKGFRLSSEFETVDPSEAFNQATEEDMKWMASYIMQLTPDQIEDALVASGYAKYEVENYRDKLLKRRENMMKDLNGSYSE